MTYRGTFRNGVVEVAGEEIPPNGAAVRVELIGVPHHKRAEDRDLPELLNWGRRAVRCGVRDLTTDLDRCLYGARAR